MIDKIKKRLKQVFIFGIILIIGALVLAPSKDELLFQNKKKIESLSQELKSNGNYKVYDNKIIYKQLVELEPNNKEYKKGLEKFTKKNHYLTECRISSRESDKKSLKISDSYNEKIRAGKFVKDNTIILSATFTAKNLVGQNLKYKSMYKCNINKNKIELEKISFSKVE